MFSLKRLVETRSQGSFRNRVTSVIDDANRYFATLHIYFHNEERRAYMMISPFIRQSFFTFGIHGQNDRQAVKIEKGRLLKVVLSRQQWIDRKKQEGSSAMQKVPWIYQNNLILIRKICDHRFLNIHLFKKSWFWVLLKKIPLFSSFSKSS